MFLRRLIYKLRLYIRKNYLPTFSAWQDKLWFQDGKYPCFILPKTVNMHYNYREYVLGQLQNDVLVYIDINVFLMFFLVVNKSTLIQVITTPDVRRTFIRWIHLWGRPKNVHICQNEHVQPTSYLKATW